MDRFVREKLIRVIISAYNTHLYMHIYGNSAQFEPEPYIRDAYGHTLKTFENENGAYFIGGEF